MSRTPPAPVTPSVLRWAREDAGLSESELGALARVAVDRVKDWEAGTTQPTLGQLRLIADGLRRPVAFFLAPTPPEAHTEQPPDFRSMQRGLSRALRRELRRALDRRRWYLDLIDDEVGGRWQAWREKPPPSASEARDRLQVSVEDIARTPDANGALTRWIEALEAQGLLVFQMSGIDVAECRGFAYYDDDLPLIVLNGADAPQARSFTLLHEFAHLLAHSGAVCLLDEDREVEQSCNRFAAAMLMPEDAVRMATTAAEEPERVARIARAFRVSPVAAAVRLRDLAIVGQETVNLTILQAAVAAQRAAEHKRSGGPAHHFLKRRNLGDRYIGVVLDALARQVITLVDATYYLESNVATFERLGRSLVGARA